MRSFYYEHRFPISPEELITLMDAPFFREYLNLHMPGRARTEQDIRSNTASQRVKHLRTTPQFSLPSRVEKLISRFQPHVDQEMTLDKAKMIETVRWRAPFGHMAAQARYFSDGSQGTVRRYEGSFECTLPLVARIVEPLILKQLGPMYDAEVELTRRYVTGAGGALSPRGM